MHQEHCDSGFEVVGPIPWGSHFCEFYHDADDLIETSASFFGAGLRSNQCCVWVVSDPLSVDTAWGALARKMSRQEFDTFKSHMEIIDALEWYSHCLGGSFLQLGKRWFEMEERALNEGLKGLRISGNTGFLPRHDWDRFIEYETEVNRVLKDHRVIALCTYPLERTTGSDVLDVVKNHEFTVARRYGQWEIIESSAIKKAKEALQSERDSLETKVVERTQALREAIAARDEFLAMLGHELRNPLAPIRQASEFMKLTAPNPQIEMAANVIERQVAILTRQVDDLLDVSRFINKKVELRKQVVDARECLASALQTLQPRFTQKGHLLRVETDPHPLPVHADPTRLTQVFTNLLDNACKYTPAPGLVTVLARALEGHLHVDVQDTGRGIDPQDHAKIFDLFYQNKRSLDRSEGGLGVGLSVVKSIVEQHDGEVTVASEGTNQGATFTVRIPLAMPADTSDALSPDGTASCSRSKARVLVVDDNRDNALMLTMTLKHLDCEVVTCHDGECALARLRSQPFDLALLDIGLPLLDGYALVKQARALPIQAQCHFVAVTGYGQQEDRERALAAGFHEHLVKPIDFARISEIVRRKDA